MKTNAAKEVLLKIFTERPELFLQAIFDLQPLPGVKNGELKEEIRKHQEWEKKALAGWDKEYVEMPPIEALEETHGN